MKEQTLNRLNLIALQQRNYNETVKSFCDEQRNNWANRPHSSVNHNHSNALTNNTRVQSRSDDKLLIDIKNVLRQSVGPLFELPKTQIYNEQMKKQLQKLKGELKIKGKSIDDQQNLITTLRQENQVLVSNLNKIKRENERQLTLKDQQINKLKNKIKRCVSSLNLLKNKMPLLKQNLSEIHTKCKSLQVRGQIEANSLEQLKSYMRKVRYESSFEFERKLKYINSQFQKKIDKITLMQNDIEKDILKDIEENGNQDENFERRLNKFHMTVKRYIKLSSAFAASQIVKDMKEKEWLINNIGQMVQSNRLQTHLIYQLDGLNKTNFHYYIDGKYNILIVIQLVSGLKIGGFCVTPVTKEKVQKHKNGFLFSLSLFQQYLPKNDSSLALVSYDDFFLIFGNSQIRIKTQQTKIYSNFSTNSGVYNSNGKKISDFLGVNQSEVGIANYQIYEIISK